jgi:hypothetical protein
MPPIPARCSPRFAIRWCAATCRRHIGEAPSLHVVRMTGCKAASREDMMKDERTATGAGFFVVLNSNIRLETRRAGANRRYPGAIVSLCGISATSSFVSCRAGARPLALCYLARSPWLSRAADPGFSVSDRESDQCGRALCLICLAVLWAGRLLADRRRQLRRPGL